MCLVEPTWNLEANAYVVRIAAEYRLAALEWLRQRYRSHWTGRDLRILEQCSMPYISYLLTQEGISPPEVVYRGAVAEANGFSVDGLQMVGNTPVWVESYRLGEPKLRNYRLQFGEIVGNEEKGGFLSGRSLLESLNPLWGTLARNILGCFICYKGAPAGFSGSTPMAFGAVFFSSWPERDLDWSELLVHETLHAVLHILRCYGPFMLNEEEVGYSDFREESRPLLGIFHSMAALRLIEDLHQAYLDGSPLDCGASENQYLRNVQNMRAGCQEALKCAKWTKLGESVWEWILSSGRRYAALRDVLI